MSVRKRSDGRRLSKRRKRDDRGRLLRPAAGLEAEFTLLVDGHVTTPEQVFGSPANFIRGDLMHRTGRSFHLPTAGAIYFDTGVIEIATAPVELERGCFARLARSLWESIEFVRTELDAWERHSGRRARLQGFSTHYNLSLDAFAHLRAGAPRLNALAFALTHVLPAPVMLLATNVESTGVGVRPRRGRIEVTADYSPDVRRVAAAGGLIAGIVSEVSRWARPDVRALERAGIPIVVGFAPIRHTSRSGWLARSQCYALDPFACDPDAVEWQTSAGRMSLRQIARTTADVFSAPVRAIADRSSYRRIRGILAGRQPSWLDEDVRPAAYDDVGRRRRMPREFSRLQPSGYERVVRNAVAQKPLIIEGEPSMPERVCGWSRVRFRGERTGAAIELTFDELVPYLEEWER